MKKKSFLLVLMPLALFSCSKSDKTSPAPSTTPREYQVEYRIMAVNYPVANSIIYYDQTNTMVTEMKVPLPKTYTFKRTMKTGDYVGCGAFPAQGDATASATVTILLDGKTVATKTDAGPNPQATTSYVLP